MKAKVAKTNLTLELVGEIEEDVRQVVQKTVKAEVGRIIQAYLDGEEYTSSKEAIKAIAEVLEVTRHQFEYQF